MIIVIDISVYSLKIDENAAAICNLMVYKPVKRDTQILLVLISLNFEIDFTIFSSSSTSFDYHLLVNIKITTSIFQIGDLEMNVKIIGYITVCSTCWNTSTGVV